MGRRLYYVDWYGKVRRDRKAEKKRPDNVGWAGRALMILAVLALILVIASSMH